MDPEASARYRVRVLFLGSRTAPSWAPWGRDIVAAVGRSHDISIVDPDRPMVDQVADATVDVIVDNLMQASPALAEAAAGHVRLWQLGSVGYDKIDVASLGRHGVPVANCPGSSSARGLAEHALTLAMLVLRRFDELQAAVAASTLVAPIGRQLVGRTLLLIGFGASARALATRASAMGMRVVAVQRRGADPVLQQHYGLDRLTGMDALDELLGRADVVSLHIPYEAATRHILDRRRLWLLPPGSVVVNVARGGLIDEVALADAIRAGRISGAGLDVVEGEPAGPGHPMWHMERVILTPHIAGATEATSRRRARFAAHNISRVAAGLAPLCLIPARG